MDIETQETILKIKFKNNAHKNPHINFPIFCFSHKNLRYKRNLWTLLKNITGFPEFENQLFLLLKKIVKNYDLKYDKIVEQVILLMNLLYPKITDNRKKELFKLSEDLLKVNKYNKNKKLYLRLTNLKFFYLDTLHRKTTDQDIHHIQNLLYKKDYINNPKFHFLVLRFQINIDKYFYCQKKIKLPIKIQDYVDKGIDIRFYRMSLKKLAKEKKYFECLFLIQTLLSEYEGYDESYYYAKKCLKICKLGKIDVPDIFFKNFEIYYMNSKKICEHLIDLHKKEIFSDYNENLLKMNVLILLTNTLCSKKIWIFFDKFILNDSSFLNSIEYFDQINFWKFHIQKIVKKVNNPGYFDLIKFMLKVLMKFNSIYFSDNFNNKCLIELIQKKISFSEKNEPKTKNLKKN